MFAIYLPKFKVHQFGSSVNGLGFKGCDLDVCLQTNFEEDVSNLVYHFKLMKNLVLKFKRQALTKINHVTLVQTKNYLFSIC